MEAFYFIYMIIALLLMPVFVKEDGPLYKMVYLIVALGIPFFGIYVWWRMGR